MARGKAFYDQHRFAEIPRANIPRSVFDRSHGHLTNIKAGFLYPLMIDEVLPGDTFNVNGSVVIRCPTLTKPIADTMLVDLHGWFCPSRILWDSRVAGEGSWERFCGAQDDPDDSTDFELPKIDVGGGVAYGTLPDFMGIPPGVAALQVNALPFRMYNKVFNDWYRDQNLSDPVAVHRDDGATEVIGDYVLKKRQKRHDYFTSALPWPQKGDAVDLPLGTSAPVTGTIAGAGDPTFNASGTVVYARSGAGSGGVANADWYDPGSGSWSADNQLSWNAPALSFTNGSADLSSASAATILQLRQAMAIQAIYEKDARSGTRYVEQLKAFWGVTSPDFRLQRPEYLGGHTTTVNVTTVPRMSGSNVGDLHAYGVTSDQGFRFVKSFVEHGYIMVIASVRAPLTYQKGLNRMWTRTDRWDFFWPQLAHIGEQAVRNDEIWAAGSAGGAPDSGTNDADPFGYQERYGEYKYAGNRVSNNMRSDAAGSLDIWHLAEDFDALPVLNESFLEVDPPIDRITAVSGEDAFIVDSYFRIAATRPMPLYNVPGGHRL